MNEVARSDTLQKNVAIIEQYYEAWSSGNPERIAAFFAPEFQGHTPSQTLGLTGLLENRRQLVQSFPDQTLTTLDVVAEGGKVVARWLSESTFLCEFNGIPPTRCPVSWHGVTIYRLQGSKITELWDFRDRLAILEQLKG